MLSEIEKIHQSKVVILGAGESGVGAAKLAKHKNYLPFLSEGGQIKKPFRKVLLQQQIPFEENSHEQAKAQNPDLVIKSPGIPPHADIVRFFHDKGIPIISEIEFAAKFTKAQIVGVTGTNGKTTTASLIYHLLKDAGKKVDLCGNIGKSFAATLIDEPPKDFYVIELSSFQLENIEAFNPNIAVMLNITPDHLDRYEDSMEGYIKAKFRLIENQTERDFFVFNEDDPNILKAIKNLNIKSKKLPFSRINKALAEGAFLDNKLINIRLSQNAEDIQIEESKLRLRGQHNQYNTMAASMVSSVLEIKDEQLRQSLSTFKNVAHRIEEVDEINNISFINDSKGTNVNATWYAIESMDRKVIWIAGGVDKGNDYSLLQELVSEKVVGLVSLGKDNTALEKAFENTIPTISKTQNMEDAVRKAYDIARELGAPAQVLLSPACASFDLFQNYEARGDAFKAAVLKLKQSIIK